MTNNEQKALVLIQQSYFDVCDVLSGSSFKELGYDNKQEFLEELKARLAEVEERLFPNQ